MKKVIAVVLNYKRAQSTVECIQSLKMSTDEIQEIIVVDNASCDESVEYITKNIPEIKIIESKRNLGYTGGMNLGLRCALENQPEYIWIMNSDVLVKENTLEYLLQEIEKKPNIGAASGTIYYYPNKNKIWYAGGNLVYWRASAFTSYKRPKPEDESRIVSFLSGCSIIIRVKALQNVGLFDERYFMFNEDAELSSRIKKKKYELLYVPGAVLYHRVDKELNTPFRLYYSTRNRLLFLETAPLKIQKHIGRLYFVFVFALKLLLWMVFNPSLFRAARWGIVDYFSRCFYKGRGLNLK